MEHVDFRVDEDITLHIRGLEGALLPSSTAPVSFDAKDSFLIRVDRGEIAVDAKDLAVLMNRYVFAAATSPLSAIDIRVHGDRLRLGATLHSAIDIQVQADRLQLGATLHKVLDVRIELEGVVDVVPGGAVRLRTKTLRAAGIPLRGLMDLLHIESADLIHPLRGILDLLHIESDDLIHLDQAKGVWIAGDDFLLDPQRMLPPPRIRGEVTRVRVEGPGITLTFGHPADRPLPPPDVVSTSLPASSMSYRGGMLRFGRLTMTDADLRIEGRQRPLDFFLESYQQQLVASEVRVTEQGGLRVVMPGYHEL